MDMIDRKIVDVLRRDARLPLKTIAGIVGLARSSVRSRIARLEATGAIRGYRAVIAAEHAGYTSAMVSLHLERTPMPDVVAQVVADPAVERCYSLAGEVDLLVEITAVATDELNVARNRLSTLPGVVRAQTALILKRDKSG